MMIQTRGGQILDWWPKRVVKGERWAGEQATHHHPIANGHPEQPTATNKKPRATPEPAR